VTVKDFEKKKRFFSEKKISIILRLEEKRFLPRSVERRGRMRADGSQIRTNVRARGEKKSHLLKVLYIEEGIVPNLDRSVED